MYPIRAQLSPRMRVFAEWVSRLYASRFGEPAPERAAAARP
jgi:hypothetical protein